MTTTIHAPFSHIADDVVLGERVRIVGWANLYGCRIGDDTLVGPFTEIGRGVVVGRRCKVQSHVLLCPGVVLEDEVFIGHGVVFTNDRFPRVSGDWTLERTVVQRGASIGSNATVLCGLRIGRGALVGAGSVVTRDVPPFAVVAGNPARVLRVLEER